MQTKFKQTEIGEIPENWEVKMWGDVASLEYGRGLRGYKEDSGKYRVYGTNGPIGWHDEFLSAQSGVIVGRKGAYRGIHYSPDPFYVIDTAFYLKHKVPFDMKWAYFSLLTQDINGMDSGSAIPSTSRDQFYKLLVALPPLVEQQQIASILASLDDKIELNRKMNKTLEEMGKALFKRWFVDFEFPNNEGEPYKSSGGEVVDSGLGKIPKGWRVGTIKDIATVKSGFAFKGSTFNDFGEYGVIKIKNILDPDVDISDMQYVSSEEVTEGASQFVLNSGDILIAMSGNTTGKIGILVKDINELVLNQRAGKYFIKDEKYHWFLYYLLRSGDVQKGIIEKAYGSAQPNISPSILEGISMLMPGEHLVKTFQDICNPLMGKYVSNQIQIYKLSKIRDSLLPRLMSGKLRVKN